MQRQCLLEGSTHTQEGSVLEVLSLSTESPQHLGIPVGIAGRSLGFLEMLELLLFML